MAHRAAIRLRAWAENSVPREIVLELLGIGLVNHLAAHNRGANFGFEYFMRIDFENVL
jgi:hypothetical protein